MRLFQLLILIISPDDPDTSTIPHHVPQVLRPDKSVELGVAAADSELGRKSVVSATAKLLCVVRDSKGAFVPLKSIAGLLYSILENCQVWLPLCTLSSYCLWPFKQTEVDAQAIELLAPRLKVLSNSLCAPIHKDDVNEKGRAEELEQ